MARHSKQEQLRSAINSLSVWRNSSGREQQRMRTAERDADVDACAHLVPFYTDAWMRVERYVDEEECKINRLVGIVLPGSKAPQ